MAKRRTLRQRLKRDPANQRLPKLKAWAKRNGVLEIGVSGLLRVPRLIAFADSIRGIHLRFEMKRRERRRERRSSVMTLSEFRKLRERGDDY